MMVSHNEKPNFSENTLKPQYHENEHSFKINGIIPSDDIIEFR